MYYSSVLIYFLICCNLIAVDEVTSNFPTDFIKNIKTFKCSYSKLKAFVGQIQELSDMANEAIQWKHLKAQMLGQNKEFAKHKEIITTDVTELLRGYIPAYYCNCDARLPASCDEALTATSPDGVYQLYLPGSGLKPFFVYCMKDANRNGSVWTVIQRRQGGFIKFFRKWKYYEHGFGNLNGEFFLGLRQLYALTHSQLHELRIDMEDFTSEKRFALYKNFVVGDKQTQYALKALGSFYGNAGDSLTQHQSEKFSTFDKLNENLCPIKDRGGWWYLSNDTCHFSNLNGRYTNGSFPKLFKGKGIDWTTWHGYYYSLKYVQMAIRPVKL